MRNSQPNRKQSAQPEQKLAAPQRSLICNKLNKRRFAEFLKISALGGFFSLLSFLSFNMIHFFTKDDVARLSMAIRTDDVSMALAALDRNSIIIFFCTLVTAFIGFISGAISIFLIKKSEEQLELATNPTTKQ